MWLFLMEGVDMNTQLTSATKTRGICLTLSFFIAKEKKGTGSVT